LGDYLISYHLYSSLAHFWHYFYQ